MIITVMYLVGAQLLVPFDPERRLMILLSAWSPWT
jgi:hypothetical protein